MQLAVFGATAVLTVTNVSRDHYGEYAVWTRNQIGGWDESKLKFKLIPICEFAIYQIFYITLFDFQPKSVGCLFYLFDLPPSHVQKYGRKRHHSINSKIEN